MLRPYLYAPRFAVGDTVDHVSDDGSRVITAGLKVKEIHGATVEATDGRGEEDTYLMVTLKRVDPPLD